MTTPFICSDIEQRVKEIVKDILEDKDMEKSQKCDFKRYDPLIIPVSLSNRYVHLCRKDMDILFGEGSELTPDPESDQEGFFIAKETVTLAGPNGALKNVQLRGPLRDDTQLELLSYDRYRLGIEPPIQESGTQHVSPTLTIVGPNGAVVNSLSGMIARRHIHMNASEASWLGLKDGDYVKIQTFGERKMVFYNVQIRLSNASYSEFHLDIDEANAASISDGDNVEILL